MFLRLKDEPLGPNRSARKLRQECQTTSLASAFGSSESNVGRLILQSRGEGEGKGDVVRSEPIPRPPRSGKAGVFAEHL